MLPDNLPVLLMLPLAQSPCGALINLDQQGRSLKWRPKIRLNWHERPNKTNKSSGQQATRMWLRIHHRCLVLVVSEAIGAGAGQSASNHCGFILTNVGSWVGLMICLRLSLFALIEKWHALFINININYPPSSLAIIPNNCCLISIIPNNQQFSESHLIVMLQLYRLQRRNPQRNPTKKLRRDTPGNLLLMAFM